MKLNSKTTVIPVDGTRVETGGFTGSRVFGEGLTWIAEFEVDVNEDFYPLILMDLGWGCWTCRIGFFCVIVPMPYSFGRVSDFLITISFTRSALASSLVRYGEAPMFLLETMLSDLRPMYRSVHPIRRIGTGLGMFGA